MGLKWNVKSTRKRGIWKERIALLLVVVLSASCAMPIKAEELEVAEEWQENKTTLSEQTTEDVRYTIEKELNIQDNTVVVRIDACGVDEQIQITGIVLPDGQLVQDTKSEYLTSENGDYLFEIQYDKVVEHAEENKEEESDARDALQQDNADQMKITDSFETSEISEEEISDEEISDEEISDKNTEDDKNTIDNKSKDDEKNTEEKNTEDEKSIGDEKEELTQTTTPTEETLPEEQEIEHKVCQCAVSVEELYEPRMLDASSGSYYEMKGSKFYLTEAGRNYYSGRNLIIPSTVNGIAVRSIGSAGGTSFGRVVSGIVFPRSNPISIDSYCGGNVLRGVLTIPANVKNLGYNYHTGETAGVFYNSPKITQVIFEGKDTIVGRHTFEMCTGLQKVVLPSELKIIPYAALSNCQSLTSITIPESVTEIGDFALRYTGLQSVTIPKNVRVVGKSILGLSSKLTDVYIDQYEDEASASLRDAASKKFGSGSDNVNVKVHWKTPIDKTPPVITYTISDNVLLCTFKDAGGLDVVTCKQSNSGVTTPLQCQGRTEQTWRITPIDSDQYEISAKDISGNMSKITIIPKKYTLSYQLNLPKGVVATAPNAMVKYETQQWGNITNPTITNSGGYQFVGWYSQPGGKGNKITSLGRAEGSLILYGYWEDKTQPQITYTITKGVIRCLFRDVGGLALLTCKQSNTEKPTFLQCQNGTMEYTWNLTPIDCDLYEISATDIAGNVGKITIRPKRYILTYQLNAPQGVEATAPTNIERYETQGWGSLSKPTINNYNGYQFAGWYSQPSGKGDKITDPGEANGNRSVYGYWERSNKYKGLNVVTERMRHFDATDLADNINDGEYVEGSKKNIRSLMNIGAVYEQNVVGHSDNPEQNASQITISLVPEKSFSARDDIPITYESHIKGGISGKYRIRCSYNQENDTAEADLILTDEYAVVIPKNISLTKEMCVHSEKGFVGNTGTIETSVDTRGSIYPHAITIGSDQLVLTCEGISDTYEAVVYCKPDIGSMTDELQRLPNLGAEKSIGSFSTGKTNLGFYIEMGTKPNKHGNYIGTLSFRIKSMRPQESE